MKLIKGSNESIWKDLCNEPTLKKRPNYRGGKVCRNGYVQTEFLEIDQRWKIYKLQCIQSRSIA